MWIFLILSLVVIVIGIVLIKAGFDDDEVVLVLCGVVIFAIGGYALYVCCKADILNPKTPTQTTQTTPAIGKKGSFTGQLFIVTKTEPDSMTLHCGDIIFTGKSTYEVGDTLYLPFK